MDVTFFVVIYIPRFQLWLFRHNFTV